MAKSARSTLRLALPLASNDPAMNDGVAVLRLDKIAANFACEGDAEPIDIGAVQGHLQLASDLFTDDID